MKKFTIAALTAATALSLAACNEAADDTATTDDTVVTDTADGTDTTVVVDETMPADQDGMTVGVDSDGVSVEGSVDVNDDVSVEVDTNQ